MRPISILMATIVVSCSLVHQEATAVADEPIQVMIVPFTPRNTIKESRTLIHSGDFDPNAYDWHREQMQKGAISGIDRKPTYCTATIGAPFAQLTKAKQLELIEFVYSRWRKQNRNFSLPLRLMQSDPAQQNKLVQIGEYRPKTGLKWKQTPPD